MNLYDREMKTIARVLEFAAELDDMRLGAIVLGTPAGLPAMFSAADDAPLALIAALRSRDVELQARGLLSQGDPSPERWRAVAQACTTDLLNALSAAEAGRALRLALGDDGGDGEPCGSTLRFIARFNGGNGGASIYLGGSSAFVSGSPAWKLADALDPARSSRVREANLRKAAEAKGGGS